MICIPTLMPEVAANELEAGVRLPVGTTPAQAARVVRDERRWEVAREVHQDAGLTGLYDGLTPIEEVFTPDEIKAFDRALGRPAVVGGRA